MTDAQTLYKTFGGVTLPIQSGDVDSSDLSYACLDPGQTMLLDLFEAAIQAEFAATWATVAATLPTTPDRFDTTTAVAYKLPLPPYPELLQQVKVSWPLLCLHRFGEAEYGQDTIESEKRVQQWLLHYILGPFDVGGLGKMYAVPQAVAAIVNETIAKRGHPNYQSGALQFFGSTLAGPHTIDSVRLLKDETVTAPFEGSSARYLAGLMTLETVETVTENLAALIPIQAMDLHVGLGDATGILPDFIVADTDHPGLMYDHDRGW